MMLLSVFRNLFTILFVVVLLTGFGVSELYATTTVNTTSLSCTRTSIGYVSKDSKMLVLAKKQLSIGINTLPIACDVIYSERACDVYIARRSSIKCYEQASEECPTVSRWKNEDAKVKTRTWVEAENPCAGSEEKSSNSEKGKNDKPKTEDKKQEENEKPFKEEKINIQSKEQVKKLQKELNKNGYDVGKEDGVFGRKTKNALKRYQKDNGLKADGIPGVNTVNKFNSQANLNNSGTEATAGKVDSVRALQSELNKMGYNAGKVDGKAGKNTRRALSDFQEKHGLTPTGKLDKTTVVELNKTIGKNSRMRSNFSEKFPDKRAPNIDYSLGQDAVRKQIAEQNHTGFKARVYKNGDYVLAPKDMAKGINKAVSSIPDKYRNISSKEFAAFLRQEDARMSAKGDGLGQVNAQTRRQFSKAYKKIYGGSIYKKDPQTQLNRAALVLNAYKSHSRCGGNLTCAIVSYNAGPNGRTFKNYRAGRAINSITRGYTRSVPRYVEAFNNGTTPSYGRGGRTYLNARTYAYRYWRELSRELNN